MDMRDIAKLAGVSSATVSRVINSSSLVRPETEERVRKVIEEVKNSCRGTSQPDDGIVRRAGPGVPLIGRDGRVVVADRKAS